MSKRPRFERAAMILALASCVRLASAGDPVVVTRVAVVDPSGGPTRHDMTVVVVGERIAAIDRDGAVKIPAGARVLDGAGKYLIPGLLDMHAHVFTHRGDAFFPLYAVNGVTGVRDMHTVVPMSEVQEHRRRLAEGSLLGPHLVAVAGPLIAGPAARLFPAECRVATPEEARAAVVARKRMGVDFIKVHGGLSREILLAIGDEARRQGLPFAGHAPGPPGEASDAGQRSIEHNTGVLMAPSRARPSCRGGTPRPRRSRASGS
jgi:hypothetical protein